MSAVPAYEDGIGTGESIGRRLQEIACDCRDARRTEALPRPDAVFIGGHGGRLPEMLAKIKENLQPGGCIVFNSVSADSKNAFTKGAEAAGLIPHPSVRIALNDYKDRKSVV